MRLLAVTLLISTLACGSFAAPRGMASASSGSGEFAPERAVDGNPHTRWSSDWRDNEWWQFSFFEPTTLAGLKIEWENAFAEIYHIAASDDGTNWHTLVSVNDGDGQTDLLFFAPLTTWHVRIICEQRGTGWGNSIWEATFISPADAPRITASSCAPSTTVNAALDGSRRTVWHAHASTEAWFQISFPQPEILGGLTLYWETSNVTFCCLQSTNDVDWTPLTDWQTAPSMLSSLTWSPASIRALRILCAHPTTSPAIAELEFHIGAAGATPLRRFTLFARAARPGSFPLWLSRQQEFWTIVGTHAHPEEALLGETGVIEPRKYRPAVLPILSRGRHLFTYANLPRTPSLLYDDPPVARVMWGDGQRVLSVTLIADGNATTAWAHAIYFTSPQRSSGSPAHLALFIRPLQLNPVWQHGGFAPIYTASWHFLGPHAFLFLNHELYLVCRRSDLAGIHAYVASEDDVSRVLTAPQRLVEQECVSYEGLACAAFVLRAPRSERGQRTFIVSFPLQTLRDALTPPPVPSLSSLRSRPLFPATTCLLRWPDEAFTAFARANLAYMLLTHDGTLFKPGPRNYNHSWMRDGAVTSLALLRYGYPGVVREFLLTLTNYIATNGWVPFLILENGTPAGIPTNLEGGEGQEYDSQGQFIFTVHQYYLYTRDRHLVRTLYPHVHAAADFIRALRRARMTPAYKSDPAHQPYYGILPHSNSHEGYFPARHSYWDNFWAIRGLEDAAALATLLGFTNDAAWMRAEARDLRVCVYNSITTVMARANLTTIPGCVELADFDPTSTSIAFTACGLDDFLPYAALTNTYARYRHHITPRLDQNKPDTFTPYEARNAEAFVRLGQRENALALLRHLINHSTRPRTWHHLAEVIHADPRKPAYIGDMPHTWVGADVLNALRSLVVYERGDQLVLGAGLDPAWLAAGVNFTNLFTAFGTLSYSAQLTSNTFSLTASGTATPPGGFSFALPAPDAQHVKFLYIPTNLTYRF